MGPKVVLIGEDDDAIADTLADAIGDRAGYRPVVMSDGSFVLETARRIKPDALILDIGLPGLDGVRIYDELRADPGTERTPVLFISAAAAYHARELAGRGVTDVFAKPFDLNAVLDRLFAVCPTEDAELDVPA